MMEEAEAVMDAVQMEDTVLLPMEDHLHVTLMIDYLMEDTLHVVLMGGHQMEGHLHATMMADHQMVGTVLQEQGAPDHLQPVMEEAAMADQKVHHQAEEINHQAVDVKKVVPHTDKFSPDSANEK